MKRASKELLNELTELLKAGHSCEAIAEIMNAKGSFTPNGMKWNLWNVSDYKSRHNLMKRAKLSNLMKERHASGEMAKIKASKSKPSNGMTYARDEKIKTILSLNLSKEALLTVLKEVL